MQITPIGSAPGLTRVSESDPTSVVVAERKQKQLKAEGEQVQQLGSSSNNTETRGKNVNTYG